jgi:2-polyprenyl-6-methoxyphenol hydroxylase-like FAD-dependent oxidoreductase
VQLQPPSPIRAASQLVRVPVCKTGHQGAIPWRHSNSIGGRGELVNTARCDRVMTGSIPVATRDLGWDVYSMSRPLIERVVRECVQQRSNITLRQRYRVRDLVASADGAAVTAVRYENAVGNAETLHADLIIDASGRGGLTLGFLEAIGQPQPEETLIGVDIGYATAIFTIPDDAPFEWKSTTRRDRSRKKGVRIRRLLVCAALGRE